MTRQQGKQSGSHSGGGGANGGGGKRGIPQNGWEKGDIVRDMVIRPGDTGIPRKPGSKRIDQTISLADPAEDASAPTGESRRKIAMQIQVNTDGNIEGNEALATQVSSTVESALSRFSEQITRVEVHLSDENSGKKGGNEDMRCVLEARLEGRQPVAVTHQAETVDRAVDGAADKLTSLLESTLGRLRDR